jgi:anthranilate phosphoribosyltransferase
MGPKFVVTHSQVLSLAGVNVALTTEQACDQLTNSDLGWAFLDQAQVCPSLFALQDLRTRMIKRPSLATLEKMVMPIKASGKTHLQIGFVHKSYPEVLAWMAHAVGFDSALIVRGIEGGILPTLRETARCFRSASEHAELSVTDPAAFGLAQTTRGVLPIANDKVTASETLELGLKALAGHSGPALDSLIYGGALALWHCGIHVSQRQAADHVRQVIQSGRAQATFQNVIS